MDAHEKLRCIENMFALGAFARENSITVPEEIACGDIQSIKEFIRVRLPIHGRTFYLNHVSGHVGPL